MPSAMVSEIHIDYPVTGTASTPSCPAWATVPLLAAGQVNPILAAFLD